MEVLISKLQQPTALTSIHREECTRCFYSQDSILGIDLCLTCFNGSCPSTSKHNHAALHFNQTGHAIALNIKRIKKIVGITRDENEPPIKKLAIREEPTEAELYEFITTPIHYTSPTTSFPIPLTPHLTRVIERVMSSMSSAQKSEVKAWEEEITTCHHTENCIQVPPTTLPPAGLATCAFEGCDLTTNLWLCLICGSLGCGRKQFGGGGGNGHAVEHTNSSDHAVAVKMGTIEPEGTADVYCYNCDDAKLDTNLIQHLSNFGIVVGNQVKTEKSMTELQLDQNLKFDFAMMGEDGKLVEPIFGPNLTGLSNLGNSCYLAATLQSLFSLKQFQSRYLESFSIHAQDCRLNPSDCLECQLGKLANGLCSGDFSEPNLNSQDVVKFQTGIRPVMFKSLIGKGHVEFCTMKQQDADEFFKHLLKSIKQFQISLPQESKDVTEIFEFENEIRLQCNECKMVRYKTEGADSIGLPIPISIQSAVPDEKIIYDPVTIESCLDSLTSSTILESYNCPNCKKSVFASQSTKFKTFPEILVVQARRFQLINWVPQKVDVPLVIASGGNLSLEQFRGNGILGGEIELPENDDEARAGTAFNVAAMEMLTGMGFPEIRCQRALLATGNEDSEAAMNWLFGHMEDADIDDPLPIVTKASGDEPSAEAISMITDMGFTESQGRKALKETGGDPARAVEWLFSHPDDTGDSANSNSSAVNKKSSGSSTIPPNYKLKSFISHKGPSVHSGHYISHVLTPEGKWILFNDEKVIKAEEGASSANNLEEFGYVYVFERV